MAVPANLLRELLNVFLVDLDAQVEVLGEGLLALEQGNLSTARRTESYAAIMRTIHNLKGAARGLDLKDVVEICHRMETLFAKLRDEQSTPSSGFVTQCMGAFATVRQFVTEIAGGKPVSVDLQLLAEKFGPEALQASPASDGDVPSTPTLASPPLEQVHVPVAVSLPTGTAAAQAELAEEANEPPPRAAAASRAIRVGLDRLDRVSAISDELLVTRSGMSGNHEAIRRLRGRLSHGLRQAMRLYSHWNSETGSRSPEVLEKMLVASLDSLGEYERLTEQLQTSMRHSVTALGRLTTSLGHELRDIRLVPARTLLKPVMMAARSIAAELSKEVVIRLEGEEVEADRLLLERLQDPLNHLLRNAIDHGIETPEIRRQCGKNAVGRIDIRLFQRGSNVILEIEDDGKGIDADQVAEAAVRCKLITQEGAMKMSHDEKLRLILTAGFSTREEISRLSGRGVGMDVVHNGIRALQGKLDIETRPGIGTRFILCLPAMLAQERGMVAVSGHRRYVLPTLSIERTVTFSRGDIQRIEGEQAILVDGRATPLRNLAHLLELPATQDEDQDKCMAVVMAHGASQIAFIVDELENEQEIVVKPLPLPLKSVRNVRGATYDDNGNVVIVLDAQQMIQAALEGAGPREIVTGTMKEKVRLPRILVVDDSLTTRTLEKNILEANGYDVTVCVNGQEALNVLRSGEFFDMVVTDVEMPFMDGFELTAAIKSSTELEQLPVIIVTSLSRDDQRRRGMEVGADAYIVKSSFESKVLLDTIQRLL